MCNYTWTHDLELIQFKGAMMEREEVVCSKQAGTILRCVCGQVSGKLGQLRANIVAT